MKTKFLTKIIVLSLFFSALLFLFAGRGDYFQGWIVFATNIISSLMTFWVNRNDTELIKERSGAGAGTKTWDKVI